MTDQDQSRPFPEFLARKDLTATKVAAALNLHALTVEQWKILGVPRKYKDQFVELYGLTESEFDAIARAK